MGLLVQVSGFVTRRTILALGWLPARVDGALDAMLQQSLAMIDDQGPGGSERLYWFPCLGVNQAVLGGVGT